MSIQNNLFYPGESIDTKLSPIIAAQMLETRFKRIMDNFETEALKMFEKLKPFIGDIDFEKLLESAKGDKTAAFGIFMITVFENCSVILGNKTYAERIFKKFEVILNKFKSNKQDLIYERLSFLEHIYNFYPNKELAASIGLQILKCNVTLIPLMFYIFEKTTVAEMKSYEMAYSNDLIAEYVLEIIHFNIRNSIKGEFSNPDNYNLYNSETLKLLKVYELMVQRKNSKYPRRFIPEEYRESHQIHLKYDESGRLINYFIVESVNEG